MNNRKSGFYWVIIEDDEWIVAEWGEIPGCWYVAGVLESYLERELKQINETPLQPPI